MTKKIVYDCDRCGKTESEDEYNSSWERWQKVGSNGRVSGMPTFIPKSIDLCKSCSMALLPHKIKPNVDPLTAFEPIPSEVSSVPAEIKKTNE